jgi:hypothetical protein
LFIQKQLLPQRQLFSVIAAEAAFKSINTPVILLKTKGYKLA